MVKKRKKPKKKKAGSREHFSRCVVHVNSRAKQRYNVTISAKEHREIVRLIQENKIACTRLTNTRSLALVPFKGKLLPIIYNSRWKMLHTVLKASHQTVRDHYGDITMLQKRSKGQDETFRSVSGN